VRAAVAGPLLVLLAGTGLGGCASNTTASAELPVCEDSDDREAADGVVLMAQSVPTASWVPCLRRELPNGWRFQHLDARSDGARFWLNSDRAGDEAIEVRLEASCDTTGATRIASDREGQERYERILQTTPDFHGDRYYVFDGGCITFAFRLDGEARGEALGLATQTVGAISRDDLRAQVTEESDGQLNLDPAVEEGR
jgi:hypothetical protein